MLIRFLQACQESRQLYEQFFFSIYKPLHQLFGDKKATPIAKELGRVLEQWSSLLGPGPINHRMLSAESSEAVHNMNLTNKPRDMQFNLVLRLVPDFAVKGYEALFLARQWRNILGTSGYRRELKFLYRKKQWPSNYDEPTDSSICGNTFYNLERKLKQSREHAVTTGNAKNELVLNTLASRDYETGTNLEYSQKTDVQANSGCSDSFIPCSREQRIDHLRVDLKREQIKVQRIRTEILQGEIASRCTTEKAMVRPLLDTLATSKMICWGLRNEISKEEQEGNFPDHRCYSERFESRDSAQTVLSSIGSERIRSVTRPLLNSRQFAQSRVQRLHCDAMLI